MSETDFEKLGVFYLGKEYDLAEKKAKETLCLYDSRDLVTHAVCIGMTGSGKTGLCIGLIEEAAIDGIPVIAIDPKGDISNLLLQFPQLRGEDFQPWVDADQAQRNAIPIADYANQQATLWKKGLADWGEDGARIQRLQESAEFAIYTPGSNSGIPISVVKSFAAPPDSVLADNDVFSDKISATASSLLALLGIDADPLRSREHILISNILKTAWQNKQDVALSTLIQLIQKPPIRQIGALDVEAFYPAKERFELAMMLNNLLASSGFESWMNGEPLDIDRLLHTAGGKSRVSVFSIAHLSEAERMFFVSLLLNQMVVWMRSQSGTSSLRAILYMDEIFGYFPPVSNPPSKTPLLTLMKQGRAYGVGVLLASQNPIDLDYKGLANAGTWFIGRLQTERDKMRVLDGLEGAAANSGTSFNRQSMDKTMSALGDRVFLMNNVHEDHPIIFQTRWTLSYLRGPLTREQIKILGKSSNSDKKLAVSGSENVVTKDETPSSTLHAGNGNVRPLLPPAVSEYFLPLRQTAAESMQLVYRPMLLAVGNVHFLEPKAAIDSTLQYSVFTGIADQAAQIIDWNQAQPAKVWVEDLKSQPEPGAIFASLPAGYSNSKLYPAWNKEFSQWLCSAKKLTLLKSEATGDYSHARENERDFRIRLAHCSREKRDKEAEALKIKYAPKLAVLQERLRKAQQVLEREKLQESQKQMQSAISVGTTVLDAFIGRKIISRTTIAHADSVARSVGRSIKEKQDVKHATETLEAVSGQLNNLNLQFGTEMKDLEGKFDSMQLPLTEVTISAKKTNVTVVLLTLAWAPFFTNGSGMEIQAWLPA